MAQPNSEQYREETTLPSEKVDSSASAGNGGTVEQGTAGEQSVDLSGVEELREPPTSRVGYGGGNDIYHQDPNMPNQGYWEGGNSVDNEEESRYGQDRRESDSSGTVEQRGGSASYGRVNPNARPSEAKFGSSGSGGYPDEGDYSLGSYGDASSKSPGNSGRRGTTEESSGYGSEVRGGVPRKVTSVGFASGAGVTDGFGGSTPASSDIEQHEYHQAEVAPSQQDTPYSQMFTKPDGSTEGSRDRFEEEDISGNKNGGTAVEHRKEAAEQADHPESEGFLKRLMHKLSGHSHHHGVTDSTSDVKEVGSDNLLDKDEDEHPGAFTKLKDKLLPNHEKHYDEMNPNFYD